MIRKSEKTIKIYTTSDEEQFVKYELALEHERRIFMEKVATELSFCCLFSHPDPIKGATDYLLANIKDIHKKYVEAGKIERVEYES